MKKIYLFLLPILFILVPFLAQAATCDKDTTLDFIARDPSGIYIPKASITVYKQENDANGLPKPTTQFASGSTDSVLGSVHLSWRNSAVASDNYVIKVSTVNNNNASFWYYNNNFACGASASLSKTLSGILFIFHDASGNLLTNTSFSVYSQIYDSSGNALKQKKEQLVSLNSGASGQAEIYLPQGSVRSLNGAYSDQYELEFSRNNNLFSYYGIKVVDGQLTTMNYSISSLKVKLQDVAGAAYPANTNVEVYNQGVSFDNNHQLGTKVGEFKLSSDGSGTYEVKAGMYALGIKGSDGQYQYFWNMQVEDGRSAEYTVTTSANQSTSNTSSGTCPNNSTLTITLRNINGDIAPGLHYEIYEQKTDANGLPMAGNRINGGAIDNGGRALVNFKPDPRLIYALKIWDKNANLGDYWFYDAIRFVCDYNRAVTKSIPALKIILRDRSGALKKNYSFSLYAEKFDVDNNPMFESNDLVANLKTDAGGSALIYVAPYNAYRRGQSGIYALTTKDDSNNTVISYNINVSGEKDYNFSYSFSGFSGRLLDSTKNPLANKSVSLYSVSGSGSNRSLDKQLLKVNTDANGNFSFDYPTGTYALVYGDQNNKNNIFWNIIVNNVSKNPIILTAAGINSSISSSNASPSSSSSFSSKSGSLPVSPSLPSAASVTSSSNTSNYASNSLAGRILLQVEDRGQAWYVNPLNYKRYYLGRPNDAYNIMRKLGLGISNKNFDALQLNPTRSLAGRILIKVEDSGRAYYYNPLNLKLYYLGHPEDAYRIIRNLGLGISNANLNKISIAN